MKVLLLDTCGDQGTVALADSTLASPIVADETMPGRSAAERLLATVRALLSAEQWQLSDLAAIGVVTGPGSFTGVRVGLTSAKGMGEVSGVPLIAISRLALLAAAVPCAGGVCALLDAGRGEFYCGHFAGDSAAQEALLSQPEAVLAASHAAAVVVCEDVVAKAFSDVASLRLVAPPSAADALPLVLRRLTKGSFDDPMTLDANYLRRTDAEIFAHPATRRAG